MQTEVDGVEESRKCHGTKTPSSAAYKVDMCRSLRKKQD